MGWKRIIKEECILERNAHFYAQCSCIVYVISKFFFWTANSLTIQYNHFHDLWRSFVRLVCVCFNWKSEQKRTKHSTAQRSTVFKLLINYNKAQYNCQKKVIINSFVFRLFVLNEKFWFGVAHCREPLDDWLTMTVYQKT